MREEVALKVEHLGQKRDLFVEKKQAEKKLLGNLKKEIAKIEGELLRGPGLRTGFSKIYDLECEKNALIKKVKLLSKETTKLGSIQKREKKVMDDEQNAIQY